MSSDIITTEGNVHNIASNEISVANTNENLEISDLLEVLYKLIKYIISQKTAKNKGIFLKSRIWFRCEARKKNKLRCTYLYIETYFVAVQQSR